MTPSASLAELHGNEDLRRREFPVVTQKAYLAHAAVCPLSRSVVTALRAYLDVVERGGQFEFLHAEAEAGARSIAARMIGAEEGEIAFVPSTSAGLGMIAAGLTWKAGDSVVFARGDFPANVYPWLHLGRLGVQARQIEAPDGLVRVDQVLAAIDDSTRLVSLSSVHFATGARQDLDAIGRALQDRGVLFCVDAIQSLGAMPTSARYADFLVADAHKWLLGPQGMGVLFVRRSRFSVLAPALVGWKSVASQKNYGSQDLDFATSARRYEPGSLNPLGLIGLHAALRMLEAFGVEDIARHLVGLRSALVPRLLAKGYEVVGPTDPQHTSGIVSFRRDGTDMAGLYKAIDQKGFVVSLREDPMGRACIRVSPHFYNTWAELERLLGEL